MKTTEGHQPHCHNPKPSRSSRSSPAARATKQALQRIFTIPESPHSTLFQLEERISKNLQDFLSQNIVSGELPPETLEKIFSDTHLAEDPIFVSEQTDFLMEHVVSQSVNVSSPSFIGHMTSAIPYFMLPLTKIMVALNQNLVKMETSKAFTPLERQVIGILHRLFYQQSDSFYQAYTQSRQYALGVFCSGGTISNLTALWAARHHYFKQQGAFDTLKHQGLASAMMQLKKKRLVVLCSELAHYSIKKSMNILGLGTDNLMTIPIDHRYKMDTKTLEHTIKNLQSENTGIMAVVGIAGATETGSVDPLDEMARICQTHNIYFHVDAAWGGPTIFSKKFAPLLKGIELADSITMDAHKQMYVPVGVGICLFKDPQTVRLLEHHAQYIIREGSRDLGMFTVEGSRSGMTMLVHSVLRIFGHSGFELIINDNIERAQRFANMINEHPDFELITQPELNILTYCYFPHEWQKKWNQLPRQEQQQLLDKLDALTTQIQKTQRQRGQSFVSRTQVYAFAYQRPRTVFRAVLANPLTTDDILSQILKEQQDIAQQELALMK